MFAGRAAAVAAALSAAILLSQGALYAWLTAHDRPLGPTFAVSVLLALAAIGLVVRTFKAMARRAMHKRVAELAAFADTIDAGPARGVARLDARGDEFDELTLGLNRLADRLDLAKEQLAIERRALAEAERAARVTDRLASIGKVAGSIAHDLGTPLNVVSGQAELLLLGAEPDGRVARSAGTILEQALHMRDIIDNVLGFARRRRQSQAIGAQRVRPVLESAGALISDQAEDANVTWTIDATDDIAALIDPSSLLQAVTNLSTNAVRACDGGGTVRLVAERAAPGDSDPAELDRERAWVAVRVADDGVGMDEEQVRRVFQPFYSTATDDGGTGLGLAITTEIASALGGALSVDTAPGQGATFTLWLPAPAPASPDAA